MIVYCAFNLHGTGSAMALAGICWIMAPLPLRVAGEIGGCGIAAGLLARFYQAAGEVTSDKARSARDHYSRLGGTFLFGAGCHIRISAAAAREP